MQGVARHGKGLTLLAIFSWACRKEHSLISTPRIRVRRLQSIAGLTCLRGIGFGSAAPHSPTLAMGARRCCVQWSCQPQAKLLQQSPENVFRIARADLLSLHPEFSPLLAESAAASFKRVHLIKRDNHHLDGEHSHIYAFRKHEGVGAGCALCARTAACARRCRSILRHPSAIIALGCRYSLFGTCCLR
jgi:hypothetical protein